MTASMLTFRLAVAVLLVALGLVIFGRGIFEGAPLMYTLMGALMAALGVLRLRLLGLRLPGMGTRGQR